MKTDSKLKSLNQLPIIDLWNVISEISFWWLFILLIPHFTRLKHSLAA